MAPETENFRSLRAIEEIQKEKKFTIEKLIAIGYDHYLAIFDSLLPPLFKAYDGLPVTNPLHEQLKEPIIFLQAWDKRSSVSSVAATIAIFWAYQLIASDNLTDKNANDQIKLIRSVITNTSPVQKLEALNAILSALQKMYGSWKIPWGDINRYQRISGGVYPRFNDSGESLPVGLASAFLGSLAAYETIWQNSKKQYGVAGTSFVAVVEFGKKIKARSITTGGQSFDPGSKHFNDQALMFIDGKFKEVFFYRPDVENNAEKKYHPGQ